MFLSAIYASVQNVCFEDGPAHTITTNSLSVRPQPPPQPAAFSTFIALFVLGCREREGERRLTGQPVSWMLNFENVLKMRNPRYSPGWDPSDYKLARCCRYWALDKWYYGS